MPSWTRWQRRTEGEGGTDLNPDRKVDNEKSAPVSERDGIVCRKRRIKHRNGGSVDAARTSWISRDQSVVQCYSLRSRGHLYIYILCGEIKITIYQLPQIESNLFKNSFLTDLYSHMFRLVFYRGCNLYSVCVFCFFLSHCLILLVWYVSSIICAIVTLH